MANKIIRLCRRCGKNKAFDAEDKDDLCASCRFTIEQIGDEL